VGSGVEVDRRAIGRPHEDFDAVRRALAR